MTLENRSSQPGIPPSKSGTSLPDSKLPEPNPTLTRFGRLWDFLITEFVEDIEGQPAQNSPEPPTNS